MEKEIKPKKREVPSISFEYENWEDLEALTSEKGFTDVILTTCYDSIKYAIENGLTKVSLFYVDNLSLKIELSRSEFKSSLNKILKYFERIEDYDECIEIQTLISNL
jgi:hypothetical protein